MEVEWEERKLQADCSKAVSDTGAVVMEDRKDRKNRLPNCIPVWPLGSQVECVSRYAWLTKEWEWARRGVLRGSTGRRKAGLAPRFGSERE